MQRLLCLKASAGSGKTFSLALRYIALLYKGARPSEILAVTFTNKAANEMRQRIVKYLRALEQESDFLAALAGELEMSEKEILKKRPKILKDFLVSDLYILTMDSFFNKIARKFSYFLGLDPDFAIQNDDTKMLWRLFLEGLNEKAFEELVYLSRLQNGLQDFFETLYEKEKELPRVEEAPLSLQDDYEAIQQRIVPLVEECSNEAQKLVRNDPQSLLKSGRIDTILANQTIQYSRSIFNRCYSKELEELFFALIKSAKNRLLVKEARLKREVFRFFAHYRAKKRWLHEKENYLDFKDVEHFVFELLREKELQSDFLYFRLDSRIRHILIDEFQDTSVTQWKIFEPLIDEIKSSDEFRSFFYVGDTKQAIYRFRGGSSDLFDYVYKSLEPFGMQLQPLSVNYRSKKEIVEFVNYIFGLNEKAKSEEGGYVRILQNEKIKDAHYTKFDWQTNLKAVLGELLAKGAEPSSIAVLVYKNDTITEVSDLIGQEFGIGCVTTSSKRIIHQPKARAVIELLKGIYFGESGRLHMANFLSFIGKSFDETVNIAVDRPVKMIKKVLEEYDLWDTSTLKLLEHAMGYETLADFVHKIEDFEGELPNASFNGINVMTIHKAKGLEFDHVIVVDSYYEEKVPLLLYDYEGLDIKKVRVKTKYLEKVDDDYARVLQKEQEAIKKDAINKEYVAYTRAKESLWILRHQKGSSFLALQRAGIQEGEWGTLQVQRPDAKGESIEKFEKKLRYFGKQEFITEKEYEPNDYEAIYVGLAAHTLFEMDGNDYALNRYGAYCDFEEAKRLYEQAKGYKEYTKLLQDAIVYRELPFVFREKSGVIDLLIERKDEILIIDYKSVKPQSEEAYRKQVRFYMEAMKVIKQKPVRGFIFYLDECRLKEVK